MTLTYECPDCCCEIEVEFEPSVAPTIRMDPNDCDPGDPGCCDHPDTCPQCGEPITDLYDWCVGQLDHKQDRWLEDKADDLKYGRWR